MSSGSPKLARREQAIEATRRRLRRLEIEAHRIKAELARLEADYEDDVADWLSRRVRRRTPVSAVAGSIDSGPSLAVAQIDDTASLATVAGFSDSGALSPIMDDFDPRRSTFAAPTSNHNPKPRSIKSSSPQPAAVPVFIPNAARDDASALDRRVSRKATTYRKAASPVLCSLAVHAIALSVCVTVTVATIVRQEIPLFASPADLDEITVEEFSDVAIPVTKFDDPELQNVVYESDEFNVADNSSSKFEPAQIGAGTQAFGDIGQLDALPGDVGTLMAGAGSPGGGVPGGPPGEAIFFGARSKGDRFVFVVDNSSSMKGGRLDAAIAELLNATNALTPKQSFYVIFVSDQTYPMFFPNPAADMVPATPLNKKLLADWLPKAILASGNNRQLIKAMDMAAGLRPHAVFLLWDGDMKYSEKVRLEVMTHLTRPNQWDFTIHTLGLGVSSLDAEQNLTMISQAHGGTFRRVDVPTARGR